MFSYHFSFFHSIQFIEIYLFVFGSFLVCGRDGRRAGMVGNGRHCGYSQMVIFNGERLSFALLKLLNLINYFNLVHGSKSIFLLLKTTAKR